MPCDIFYRHPVGGILVLDFFREDAAKVCVAFLTTDRQQVTDQRFALIARQGGGLRRKLVETHGRDLR